MSARDFTWAAARAAAHQTLLKIIKIFQPI